MRALPTQSVASFARAAVNVSILGHGLIPGGKEKDKYRQAFSVTPTNPFGHDLEEENDFTVPQRVPYITRERDTPNAVYWVRLSQAQDQGLEFWQTKSFAIMTYATIPGDRIDKITSEEGIRVLFERLETPKPAPKVTLKMNWHSKQQQHSTSHTHVPEGEDQAEAQDVTDPSIEAELVPRKSGQTSSNMDVDT